MRISDTATAEQSTELWGAYPAENGLDGDWENYTHTDRNTPNNYWQMNLDATYEISRIRIRNRTDCCGERLNNAYVMVLDDALSCVWSNRIEGATDGQYLTFTPPQGTMGRHIRIGLVNGETNADGTFYVSIAEAEAFSPLGVDTDGDGLKDDWEVQYGLNPFVPDDISTDLDHDGLSLWNEYLADTDPSDPQSYFALTMTNSHTETLQFRCASSLARKYSLQWSTNLVDSIWAPVSGQTDKMGTGKELIFEATPDLWKKYFRIEAKQP